MGDSNGNSNWVYNPENTTMEVNGEPIGEVKNFSNSITIGGKHTNDEKALFHGLKSARRVAEDGQHEIAAEMAVLIGEYYLSEGEHE